MLIFISCYLVVIMALLVGRIWWKKKTSPTKHPLGEDVKLRRQAGEHLRKKSDQLMERLITRMAILILLPAAGITFPLTLVNQSGGENNMGLLVAAVALFLAALIWALRGCSQLVSEIQNHRLGWFGERVVADALEELEDQSFSVFHDMPCLGATGPFNLDHVVVGKGIVVVVETKTYRKPKGDPAGHKVRYDGEKLCWPTGHSTKEVEQVLRNAEWLKKELKKQLGFDITVRAALTMPGWFITGGPPKAPVLVEAPLYLTKCIAQRFPAELSTEQTQQVIRYLKSRCTDVAYEML